MRLTPHFTLEELTQSDTAIRLGIDNHPSPEVLANLQVLAEGMERIRFMLNVPIHVNSGFRCEALERVIAKKDFIAWCARRGLVATDEKSWAQYFAGKAHPKGFACDWTAPGFGSPLACIRHLVKHDLQFDQLIQEGTWAHASFAPAMRGQVLTATFIDGTPNYTKGA